MSSIAQSRSDSRSLLRTLGRKLLWWRFQLFQRHRHGRLVIEQVAGRPMIVLPEVFNPKLLRTGEFLVETFNANVIAPTATVLDLGTGSGVGAIFAARWAAHVVATDINPGAVRCAQINALLHDLEHKIETRVGDLFNPVRDELFDVILFNPPYYRGQPGNLRDYAWRSPDAFDRFLRELPAHLKHGGRALVVLSSDGDVLQSLASAQHLQSRVVREREFINETLTVFELQVKT